MGKDLKGKELGTGICQRKDKKYTARFTGKNQKRIEKHFQSVREAKKWLAEAKYEDEHSNISAASSMTVDAWFEYWINEIKGNNVRPNTVRNYKERYAKNIKAYLGKMLLCDVKPLHCQNVLNQMAKENYRNSTIVQTSITMFGLFSSALENDMIIKNPVTKTVKCTSGKESKEKRVLTVDEQKLFLDTVKGTSNYNQYAFLLQTGLRIGELIGLKWSDIDFKKNVVHIRRTMEYRHSVGEWRTGEPKSKAGYREVPLTQEAIRILKNQQEKNSKLKVVSLKFADSVFLSRNGEPTKNSAYDTKIYYYCKKAGIENFSVHTLRHTFATRCIEAGMRPKTLQEILGHSNLSITMNLYVHVTEDEKEKEMKKFEGIYNVV